MRQQDLDRINLAINNNLDKKSHLSAMMSRVSMDFDGTEKLATMSSLNVANVSLHAQSIFNTVEKMKLEADKKSLESGGESSFSDESFIRFKQGEKAMLNVLSRYNFKKDEQTALSDHGLTFNLENLKEIDAAAKDMVKNIPMGDERELFGLYFQRVSAAVKNKTYTSYEKEFNQIKAVVDKVEDTKTKTKGGSLGAAIGLPLPGDKVSNAGLGVKLGFNKYNYLTTGMDSTYFIGNLNEFSTGAPWTVQSMLYQQKATERGKSPRQEKDSTLEQ